MFRCDEKNLRVKLIKVFSIYRVLPFALLSPFGGEYRLDLTVWKAVVMGV